ncbi:MAG: hypothetical protein ACI4DW_03860 [Lachnospiraceae bacterium]
MVWQNSDHTVRNALFRALVEYDWPIINADGSRYLIYYIGFWLPSAAVGKIVGLDMAYIIQFLWAVMGVVILYYLICLWRKKVDLWPLIVMIFFSGLDYVGAKLLCPDITGLVEEAYHLEWWASAFQFSSMTTQLFWVFNQCLPAWIVTMLILLQKKNDSIYFILSFSILTSPFPFVGLIPIALYQSLKDIKQDGVKDTMKGFMSISNIIGVVVVGIVSVEYLRANSSAQVVGQDNFWEYFASIFGRYCLFILLEVGLYFILLYKYHKKDILYYIILIELLLCPLFRVGHALDFCMRVSVPALFVLMIYVIDALEHMKQKKDIFGCVALILILCLGGITSFNEIQRTLRNTLIIQTVQGRVENPESDIEWLLQEDNFSGVIEDGLFKLMMK